MEVAPLGNLKQYLKARAEMDDMSSTFSSAFAVGFIIQIIEGVEAVHRLNVSKDFCTVKTTKKSHLSDVIQRYFTRLLNGILPPFSLNVCSIACLVLTSWSPVRNGASCPDLPIPPSFATEKNGKRRIM